MSANTKEQLGLLSELDAIMATIESKKDINLDDVFSNVNISLNPFDFLLDIILRYVGLSDVLDWISDTITNIQPIEQAIKGVLLANVNATLSCHNNVFIPEYLRNNGIDFNLDILDYKQILKYNPLSEIGQCYYFGTSFYYTVEGDDKTKYYTYHDAFTAAQKKVTTNSNGNSIIQTKTPDECITKHGDINNKYDLVKAKDMNAFLWFANRNSLNNNFSNYTDEITSYSLLQPTNNKPSIGDLSSINNSLHYISKNDGEYIPYSNTTNGINWYYKNNNNECKPLFNISKYEGEITPFKFKILEAPNGFYDKFTCVKFLFNDKLEPDNNGHFSIRCSYDRYDSTEQKHIFTISKNFYIEFDKNALKYEIKNGSSDDSININDLKEYVYECYSGLTLYEFNYDYIMGMQLFDTKSLAALTINNILYGENIFGLNISLTKEEILIREKIERIIEHIFTSDSEEVNNCYFSFSNDEYLAMLKNTEVKYKNNKLFNENKNLNQIDAYSIINKYNSDLTLNEQKEIIKEALNSTVQMYIGSDAIYDTQYKINIEPNSIVKNLLKQILNSFFQSIITPKIVLLFDINRRITNSNVKPLGFEEFLSSIENQITSIILQVKDYLLRLLMEWVLKLIGDLTIQFSQLLIAEQLNTYVALIKRLITDCTGIGTINSLNFLSQEQLDSFKIDYVNYADIISDNSNTTKIINNC